MEKEKGWLSRIHNVMKPMMLMVVVVAVGASTSTSCG